MRSKKAVAGLLAACMVFALVGCGKENVQESQSSSAKEEKTVEQVASASSESREIYDAVDPKCEWARVPLFEGEEHNPGYVAVGGGRLFGINPDLAEKDPEKLERILDLFNYVSSEEGQRLVCYGREGIEYTLDGDKVVMSSDPAILKAAGFVWAYQITGRDEEEYLKTKFAYMEDKLDEVMEREVIPTYNGLVLPPEGFNLVHCKSDVCREKHQCDSCG